MQACRNLTRRILREQEKPAAADIRQTG